MRKLYPGGRDRAFNITYDDGVLQDLRFVELMNRYGLKGTFNLNSELMLSEFSWIHPNGMEVQRLAVDTARWLYRGHEIASHSLTHPYMSSLSRDEIMTQLGEDKRALEALLGMPVAGFAVPFHFYSAEIADCARECGFEYARMSEFSNSYIPCRDWYYWKTGFYHIEPGLEAFADGFSGRGVQGNSTDRIFGISSSETGDPFGGEANGTEPNFEGREAQGTF